MNNTEENMNKQQKRTKESTSIFHREIQYKHDADLTRAITRIILREKLI